jgi:flagellar biosynthesis/type III secretory pathway chaperone
LQGTCSGKPQLRTSRLIFAQSLVGEKSEIEMSENNDRSFSESSNGRGPVVLLGRLFGIMQAQLGYYKELLEVSKQERHAIIHHDLQGLRKAIEDEEQLINLTRSTERGRVQLSGEIAESVGIDPDQLTLSRIIESQAAPAGMDFGVLQKNLLEVITELDRVNRSNSRLLRSSISFINKVFNSLGEPKNKVTIYNNSGKTGVSGPGRLLVDKKW